MTCSDVQEYICDALDRQVPEQVREEFFAHLELCQACRNEFEIVKLAKTIVKRKVRHVPTPPHLIQSVIASLENEGYQASNAETWIDRIFGGKALIPSLTAGLAIVVLVLLLNMPGRPSSDSDHSASNDIIHQSLANFTLVRSGSLKPSMISCYPELVTRYFKRQNLEFAVVIPSDDTCDWYGALINRYDGIRLAHVVYKRGEDVIYVYQVKKNDAMRGSALSLPPAAKKALAETGLYTDPLHENCNVVLWTSNETLCAAVSSMKKDRLLAFLSTK